MEIQLVSILRRYNIRPIFIIQSLVKFVIKLRGYRCLMDKITIK